MTSLISLRNRCLQPAGMMLSWKGGVKLKGKFFWNICHQSCLGHYDKCLGLQAWPEAIHSSSSLILTSPYWWKDIPEKQHFRYYQKRRRKQNRSVWYDFEFPPQSYVLESHKWTHFLQREARCCVTECQSLKCGYFISAVVCVVGVEWRLKVSMSSY